MTQNHNITIKIECPELTQAMTDLAIGLTAQAQSAKITSRWMNKYIKEREAERAEGDLPEDHPHNADVMDEPVAKAAEIEAEKAAKKAAKKQAQEAEKAAKKAAKKKVAKEKAPEPEPVKEEAPEPEPVEEKPEVIETEVVTERTAEEVTVIAKKLIAASSPAVLRSVLDEVIGVGVKIGGAPKDKMPAIYDAVEAKLEELS